MKSGDFVQIMCYNPKFRGITGSLSAAIFLSLILKEGPIGGWVKISCGRAESVTGMTYKEQATARRILLGRGLILERYDRLNHELSFMVDRDGFDDAFA